MSAHALAVCWGREERNPSRHPSASRMGAVDVIAPSSAIKHCCKGRSAACAQTCSRISPEIMSPKALETSCTIVDYSNLDIFANTYVLWAALQGECREEALEKRRESCIQVYIPIDSCCHYFHADPL